MVAQLIAQVLWQEPFAPRGHCLMAMTRFRTIVIPMMATLVTLALALELDSLHLVSSCVYDMFDRATRDVSDIAN